MDEMERKTDKAGSQHSVETIGSLMAECGELAQQIDSEKERLERFMLETGGASDASDRIQAGIGHMEDALAAAEGRLQALFDAQEREAFAPEKRAVGEQRPAERASVIKDLAARKAEAATRGPQDKERKPPSAGMER